MSQREVIRVVGARQHNLKNLTLEIPKHQLVVITGVSGSGKSSLAFDTLYAEGQRRYVESLSAYARQFLEKLDKPDVDTIEGLSPAVALEQQANQPNPRSTVATVTEIYDYLRLIYAACGMPHDPQTGEAMRRYTGPQIVDEICQQAEGTRVILLAPVPLREWGERPSVASLILRLKKHGFVRARIDGQIIELENDALLQPWREVPEARPSVEIVIDRVVVREGVSDRLLESVRTALRWSGDEVWAQLEAPGLACRELRFTTSYYHPRTGFRLEPLTPKHFSFNSREGACPACHGLGTRAVIDRHLLVPDPTLSLQDGAVKSWWVRQPKMAEQQWAKIQALAKECRVSLEKPFAALSEKFREALFSGLINEKTGFVYEGLIAEGERLYAEAESEMLRKRVARFLQTQTCVRCGGRRLRPEILAVTLKSAQQPSELSIDAFCAQTLNEAAAWFASLELTDAQRQICAEPLREVTQRLKFLTDVGLGYLTLDRAVSTLSGGEAQRIRLATQIGSGLSGVLYVLDEPSIGLHACDHARLIHSLTSLRDLGNSVIVVEHDEEMIRAADHVIELGPAAGEQGGQHLFSGPVKKMLTSEKSLTGQYLSGKTRIGAGLARYDRSASVGDLTVHGASENNLRDLTVSFPLGLFTCVTGVSGSGKSTLINDVLQRALAQQFHRSKITPGRHEKITGWEKIEKSIVVDQSPIGRSPRSNPLSYIGAFTALRELYAALPAAKVRGFGASTFSFNTPGGRCEACEGEGAIRVDMHFLSDVYVTCDACNGRRYQRDVLDVTFKGLSIADVFDLTFDQAAHFFRAIAPLAEKFRTVCQCGLGYLRLGQPANTLSGGEAQRLKLAAELSKRTTGPTLYLLDEPTTGLHFADIEVLLTVFGRLRQAGHTLIVIEHHLDVVRCADWVIDLGPGAGAEGGYLVAEGPPETIAAHPQSVTGQYLAKLLKK